MLADLHSLCRTLNCVRPWRGITTNDLAPPLQFIEAGKGAQFSEVPDPPEAKVTLQKEALDKRVSPWCKLELTSKFIVLGKQPHYHGLIFQWDQDQWNPLLIVEWVFLSHHQSKNITRPQELAQLVRKARTRFQKLAGCDFACIHLLVDLSGDETSPERLTKCLSISWEKTNTADHSRGLQWTDLCPHPFPQIICIKIPIGSEKQKEPNKIWGSNGLYWCFQGFLQVSDDLEGPPNSAVGDRCRVCRGFPSNCWVGRSSWGFWEVFSAIQFGYRFRLCCRSGIQSCKCSSQRNLSTFWVALKADPAELLSPTEEPILCDACEVTQRSAWPDCWGELASQFSCSCLCPVIKYSWHLPTSPSESSDIPPECAWPGQAVQTQVRPG